MKWYLLAVLLLLDYWYIQPQRVNVTTHTVKAESAATAQPVEVAPVASNSKQQFAIDLARALGNPQPNESIVLFVEAWARAEGIPESANNSLATTHLMGCIGCHNWLCVSIYPDTNAGLAATVATLKEHHQGYGEIVGGIRTNNPQRALLGLAASPRGTSAALTMRVYNEAITQRRAPQVQRIEYTPADNKAPRGSPCASTKILVHRIG